MAAPIKPTLQRAYGNDAWGFAPAVADITTPTDTELTAVGGFNLSCSVFSDQDGVGASTDKVNLPQLLCETEQFEVNGPTTFSLPDFMVSFQPQAASGADGKKAWEALDDNATGFLWRRQGVSSTTDVAVGQFVDIIPVQLGTKVPTKTGNDASGVYAFTVGASITSAPEFNVAVVAGA